MLANTTTRRELGWKAAEFSLKDTEGRRWTLEQVQGKRGTLIMFICNHCPYVKGIIPRLVETSRTLQAEGVGVAAVMSNDTENYPEDSYENMQRFATQHGFSFPYLIDPTQETARNYNAACTPDFFGFNDALALQYCGRLDASRTELLPDANPELLLAMRQIVESGVGPEEQLPSMGCGIKWRNA